MRRPKTVLPKKLSELITVAMADLAKVERQTKVYKVNMGAWHLPNSHCSVCLAGAVMAKTMGFDPKTYADPGSDTISPRDNAALSTLNWLRTGDMHMVKTEFSMSERAQAKFGQVAEPYRNNVPDYHQDRDAFKATMRKMAKDFAKAGL